MDLIKSTALSPVYKLATLFMIFIEHWKVKVSVLTWKDEERW